MEIGQSAGKSFAYLLGVYLGDGCVTLAQKRYPQFRLNTIDEDFALATKAALADLSDYTVGVYKHDVKKSSRPNHALQCADRAVCEMLVCVTQDKQIIPHFVFSWPRENQAAFIVGLMDSEGFVAEKTTGKTGRAYYMGFKSCDAWVPDFIRLLKSFGLEIGKTQTERPYKAHYKAPTRFHIKMQSWVDSGLRFNIKRKQERVDRWAATEPYSERSRYPRKLTSETARQTA